MHINLLLVIFTASLSLELTPIDINISRISLHDTLWEKYGTKIDSFYAIYPEVDTNPPYAPAVYILFDGENLGIKFFCPKEEPPIFTSTTRDFSFTSQDAFGILIDTYNNGRSAYLLSVNAINVQSDAYGDNAAVSQDPSWDAEWYSETNLTDNGWEGMIITPIKIFRFRGGLWGLNFIESIKRVKGTPKTEVLSWSIPVSNIIDPSTFRKIKLALPDAPMTTPLEIIPYFASSYKPFQYKAGCDLGWVIRNNYSINLTYNPDFAQIEGDVDQIDLSKTKLFLLEKRPFFMEKSDILSSILQLLYTRSIEEIRYGAKITGNYNGFDLYSFFVSEGGNSPSDIICLRSKKDFKNNWFGFYEVSKFAPDHYNHSLSLDGGVKIPFDVDLDFAFSKTFTGGLTGGDDFAFRCDLTRYPINEGFGAVLSYRVLQQNYNPELGFISVPNVKAGYYNLSYTFSLDNSFVQSITPGAYYSNWTRCSDKKLMQDEIGPYLGISFPKYLDINLFIEKTYRLYEDRYYNNLTYAANATIYPSGSMKIFTSYTFGKYYDAFLKYPAISFSLYPLRNVSLDFSMDYFTTTGENEEQVMITSVRGNWNVTDKLSFRYFIQWTDISYEFQTNFLLAYDFSVGSHIYIVLNETRDISNFSALNTLPPLIDRKLYLKLCYSFKP